MKAQVNLVGKGGEGEWTDGPPEARCTLQRPSAHFGAKMIGANEGNWIEKYEKRRKKMKKEMPYLQ